jgi:hypothetical protein
MHVLLWWQSGSQGGQITLGMNLHQSIVWHAFAQAMCIIAPEAVILPLTLIVLCGNHAGLYADPDCH